MARRNSFVVTTDRSFEPSCCSDGRRRKASAGSSSNLASLLRMPSSSASMARYAKKSWTSIASDPSSRRDERRPPGRGSTTKIERTAHWASCLPASLRQDGSAYSLQLRLVQLEGYGQHGHDDQFK